MFVGLISGKKIAGRYDSEKPRKNKGTLPHRRWGGVPYSYVTLSGWSCPVLSYMRLFVFIFFCAVVMATVAGALGINTGSEG